MQRNEFASNLAELIKARRDPVYFVQNVLKTTVYPKQAEIMRRFYEENKQILIILGGMRGGKTYLASLFACYELFSLLTLPNPQQKYKLSPTSEIFILALAPSEDQAYDTIYNQIATKVENADFFRSYRMQCYKLQIIFPEKKIRILCGSSSAATMVGRTVKCVVFDELSRFEQTDSKRGARQVWTSLGHSTMTFGNEGRRIAISSPIHQNDLTVQLYTELQNDSRALCLRIPTWEMNPNISREALEAEEKMDPAAFARDFGAIPIASISPFFSDPSILRPDNNIINLLGLFVANIPFEFNTNVEYVLACDPAVKRDAFGIAIGHKENEDVYIDGVYRIVDRNPLNVAQLIKRICEHFHIGRVVTDTRTIYTELWSELENMGIAVEEHMALLPEYDELRRLLYMGKLHLPDYEQLFDELKNLQILDAKRVDHPRGGSKDVSDCVANVIWLLKNTKSIKVPICAIRVI